MKPTPEVAQALTNLRASQDFKTVLDWFRDGLELARDDCERHTASEKLFRSQGEASCLRSILQTTKAAPETLQKFNSTK